MIFDLNHKCTNTALICAFKLLQHQTKLHTHLMRLDSNGPIPSEWIQFPRIEFLIAIGI